MKAEGVVLVQDKRKAIKQLIQLGFTVDADTHTAVRVRTPEGQILGRYTLAGKNARQGANTIIQDFKSWQRGTGRFA